MKALILAAGYGTRLGNLTENTPKPLLDLVGKPLITYTLSYLAHHNIREIAINLHYKADLIQAALGDGQAWGVQITYSYEDPILGTAGAAKKLTPFWESSEPFLIIYGDLLIDQDLHTMLAFHQQKQGLATLLLHQRKKSNSIVRMTLDGAIFEFVERPPEDSSQEGDEKWVNSGVQILHPKLLAEIPPDTFSDLPRDVYTRLAPQKIIYGFPLTGYRCAIDSVARYEQAQNDLQQQNCRTFFKS